MIKWMIKGCPTESDAKASKGAPGLTDDQGASDRKSDAKVTNLARRQAQGMPAPVRTARCGGRCSPTQALAPELIEAGPLGSARAGRRGRAQFLQ